jgi:hypothetical protein
MSKSTYDFCLLFINQNESFEVIEMQTDDTLMLRDDRFAELEESELKKAKLMFKKRKMLIIFILIKFNDEIISLIEVTSKNSLFLTQLKQFDQIQLINLSISIDLISSRGQIRKMITPKDQYVTQRTREAYIAIMTQSKAAFDLSLAVQVTNSKEEDTKRLNKRLQ